VRDLQRAAAAGVRLVTVGGVAVTIRGSSYVTFDLDFCYSRDPDNLSRLAGAQDAYETYAARPACRIIARALRTLPVVPAVKFRGALAPPLPAFHPRENRKG
jgi:hypothetical protein